MAMPHNAERVGLIESHDNFCSVNQHALGVLKQKHKAKSLFEKTFSFVPSESYFLSDDLTGDSISYATSGILSS
jgi:hypothetical protein